MADPGIVIPVVAIIATFAIPITAIIVDYKRRKLVSDERRAMIEKGMEPPPIDESSASHRWGGGGTAAQHRERALRSGVVSVFLGMGMLLGAWLVTNYVSQSFLPPRIAGPLTLGGCIVAFIGLGQLAYYALSRKSAGPTDGNA